MAVFDYPTINPDNGFLVQLFQYANSVTGNAFSPLFLFTVFGVSFMSLRNFGNDKALTQSLFIVSIMGWIFFISQLVSLYVAIFPTICFFLSVFFISKEGL